MRHYSQDLSSVLIFKNKIRHYSQDLSRKFNNWPSLGNAATRYWQSSDPAVVDNKIISQILKLTIHDCSVVNSGPKGGPAR